MALGIQAYVVALLWSTLLASRSWAQYLKDNTETSMIKYSIINLNGEQVTLSWNAAQLFSDRNVTMFYRFDEHESKQCPQYILDQGYHTGCHFKTEGEDLYIFIKDTAGKEPLYFDEQKISMFFKPNPPENVTFQWAEDKLTVQCNPPQQPHCFMFELQYKSTLNQEWKSTKGRCCKIEDDGFDPGKCYSFRLRLERLEICNTIAYFSEWGAETHWKNGSSKDSCDMEAESKAIILLTSVMAMILVAFALLMGVCRLERIRRIIMPAIPDPKHIYSDLFRDHNGNFQDWIFKTDNVFVQPKVEYEEEECIIEEQEKEDTQTEKMEAQEKIP
ncbi:cytokine receptor-like factor 2 [Eublepharis macularius]|uniref:Cytokine receptor-like factor 2 n=1 Tax=Eublepharis macularius TaxID=481883 RepID=A0AA97J363_EUBMA|nr:cytokine receptor-like factor 2 [Eublepharis macularius]